MQVSQPDEPLWPLSVPIVDVGPLRSGSESRDTAVVRCRHQVDAACVESGFFVATGHGLDAEMGHVFDAARRFFALPLAAKDAVAMSDGLNGYVASGERRTGEKEMLDIGFGADARWPAVEGFREAVLAYRTGALLVASRLLAALADALGVAPTFFAERMRQPECFLRMLRYPPTQDDAPDEALPTGAHTDYGAITLLATDGVPGLEVRSGAGWAPVEAPTGSLVVNLGDMLARWTNDRYASTPHRVVAGDRSERYSIPLFVNPDPDTIVSCIPTCVTAERPCRYEPITAGEFLRGRIDGTISSGDGIHA